MSLEVSINLNSLRMIRDELNASIAQSATEFEAYLADQQNESHIATAEATISQVGGTFRLLQYPGAARLADEMSELIKVVADPQQPAADKQIEALTHCFFVLPRYIEYVGLRQSELPILVLPYINEMRVARKAPLLPEYEFFQGELLDVSGKVTGGEGGVQVAEFQPSIARLRHMYQVGLLGVINGKSPDFNYQLMHRAITRICKMFGDHAHAEIWQLACGFLECFLSGGLELTLNRKRNLAAIERMMRNIAAKGEEGLAVAPAEGLGKDMLFAIQLCDYSSPLLDKIREAYFLAAGPITDKDIAAQREAMHGSSLETFESVIKVLKDELRGAKGILEIASQNSSIDGDELNSLCELLSRIADTLSLLNLTGPRDTLLEELEKMAAWVNNLDNIAAADFLEAADTVLFIESSLSGLDRREITVKELNEVSVLSRKKVIASSHLAEAERIVIEEAQAGIALAKRAITSYVDSNFDTAHISNVAVTLSTVRGGLYVLNYSRAAAVLKSCSAFIEAHMNESSASDQCHQLLETLADALISLEYYLNEIETNQQPNEKILEVAEESLSALGFQVET